MTVFQLVILLIGTFFSLEAAGMSSIEPPAVFVLDSAVNEASTALTKKEIIRKKVIATTLAIALGPFGVHRLYLGTDKRIPVIYSITLGAFGILPLADIIAIITTKDIEKYQNNNGIVMWMK